MNIFYLDSDPIKAAEYCCDKHCIKMILESAQILCTAHSVLGKPIKHSYVLKPTHLNHPSNRWARSCSLHYKWLYNHLSGLCLEYTKRYGKKHKVEKEGLLEALKTLPLNIPNKEFSPPPQCMPIEYKMEDPVSGYRNYYIKDKSRFAKWKLENIPKWYEEQLGI